MHLKSHDQEKDAGETMKSNLRKIPLAVAISSLLAANAQAAGIVVTTNADGPLGSITEECTLRAAVSAANSGVQVDGCVSSGNGADDITFHEDLAHSTITLSEGQMEISGPLTITGPVSGDPEGVIIDGNEQSRIFRAEGPYAEPSAFKVRLDSLTLTGARATGDGYQNDGGAMHVRWVDLELEHVIISGNSTDGIQAGGSGLSIRGGNLTLNHTTVTGNRTDGPTSRGAGVRAAGGNVELIYSTISNNSTTQNGSRGGGLYTANGDVEIISSTITGNSTAGTVSQGGGMHLSNGALTLVNSTVSGNFTTGGTSNGGGMVLSSMIAEIVHSTVAYNTASDGIDGIFNDSYNTDLVLKNSLIIQAGEGETACFSEANTSIQTLVTDDSCTGYASDGKDLPLSPLQDNGGPTQTHALVAGSIAVDGAGDCGNDFDIILDQRGSPRPGMASEHCDIGAYEFERVGLSSAQLDFGEQRVNTTADALTQTLSNLGIEPIVVAATGLLTGSDFHAFSLVDDQCENTTLPVGESCSVTFEFTPDNRQAFSGKFEVEFGIGTHSAEFALSGTGIAPVMNIQPQLLSFGSIVEGQSSQPMKIYLGNEGDDLMEVLTLFGLVAPFGLASSGTCESPPFSLPAGEQCSLQLEFTPEELGPHKQAVFIPSDSFGGDQAFMLEGIGVSLKIFSDRFEPKP